MSDTVVEVDVVALALSGAVDDVADDRQLLVRVVDGEVPGDAHDDDGRARLALPARRLPPTEGLERTAQRVMGDAAIPTPRHLEQLASFGEPGRRPGEHVVTVAYLALLSTPDTVADGGWFPASTVAELLAHDQAMVLAAGVERVRAKLSYSTIAAGLLPDAFTMSELQTVYEVVLATRLDKRNFRRKVGALGLLTPTGDERRGSHRPAKLYRFTSPDLVILDDPITT